MPAHSMTGCLVKARLATYAWLPWFQLSDQRVAPVGCAATSAVGLAVTILLA
eukprot:CAMPEP_0115883104 /NCGR_PEP_ID=MMETSP0287-20121206/29379_1 /TAXON_ID=412157 /ORGANISM="Chrysochromulina rotalis, Strain UIO044" /LENGTH=51 /DNA_ID=CAMNT_0003339265 /DNA_START=80 /DNA_END=231 /DNA_ORIENTATION=+